MKMTHMWAKTSVGTPSVSTARVVAQIKTFGMWLVGFYLSLLLWFPAWGEVKIGGSPNIAPPRLAFFACLGIMILLLWVRPYRERLSRPEEPASLWIWRIVHFFFIWQLASVLVIKPELADSFTVLKSSLLPQWLAFWFGTSLVRSERGLKMVLLILAGAALLQVGLAVIEAFILKRHVFAGILKVTSSGGAFAVSASIRDGVYRAKGSFSHPLVLCHFLMSATCIVLAIAPFQAKRWQRWAMGLTAVILTGALALTRTRTGIVLGVGFFASICLIYYWLWSRRLRPIAQALARAQLIWVFAALAIGGVYVQDLLAGRTSEEIWSSYYRMEQFNRAIPAIFDSPFFGYGAGRGTEVLALGFKGFFGFAVDSMLLKFALDYGLIEAVAYVAFISIALWRLMPHRHEWALTPEIGLRLGFMMYFLCMLVMSNVHALQEQGEAQMIMIAASMAIPGRYTKRASTAAATGPVMAAAQARPAWG